MQKTKPKQLPQIEKRDDGNPPKIIKNHGDWNMCNSKVWRMKMNGSPATFKLTVIKDEASASVEGIYEGRIV